MVQPNFLLLVFLALFLFRSGAQLLLNQLNIIYLRQHGMRVPELFKDTVDEKKLTEISAYTSEFSRFNMAASLANQALSLAILLSGFLPWLVKKVSPLGGGVVIEGLIFFAILSVFGNLLRIPFSLYETFVIEARFGFNTKTFGLWLADLLKSIAVLSILGGFLLWVLLNLLVHGGDLWWVWAWALVGGYELLMLWLFPLVIAPLFNKFEPIENQSLKDRIGVLMNRVGLQVKGVFKMDESKRSRHTNAYFTGLGRSKRIVLFDTLLASHSEEEILAVLAHEIGHWKKKHVLKQIVLLEAFSLTAFYLVAQGLKWPLLYQTFGFDEPVAYAGLFLIGAVMSPLGFFLHPVESAISRKFEREADDFTLALMKAVEPMRLALKRLAADNLANLAPHPLYAWFYYSHPPLVERISRLVVPHPDNI